MVICLLTAASPPTWRRRMDGTHASGMKQRVHSAASKRPVACIPHHPDPILHAIVGAASCSVASQRRCRPPCPPVDLMASASAATRRCQKRSALHCIAGHGSVCHRRKLCMTAGACRKSFSVKSASNTYEAKFADANASVTFKAKIQAMHPIGRSWAQMPGGMWPTIFVSSRQDQDRQTPIAIDCFRAHLQKGWIEK